MFSWTFTILASIKNVKKNTAAFLYTYRMQHHVIYIPGLNDTSARAKIVARLLPQWWKFFGVIMHVIPMRWSEGKSFIPKLKNIVEKIDALNKSGTRIYLVGQSAGGAAALNAYVQRKNKVAGVVNIDGRLKRGKHVFPSLDFAAKGNPAFKASVELFEDRHEKKLSEKDRKKIMVLHPLWDDIVPIQTAKLFGTTDITMPVVTHILGGIVANIFFANRISMFFKTR